jgi:translation elongation factor P/translation initiation factor 5A
MGNKTLMEPEGGVIQIRLGRAPLYVTYSNVPDYLPHDIRKNEMPQLSYTLGQRVILSPEFENYDINDPNIKKNGHVVSDGLKVKVRVTNLNDVEVKGTVSGTLMGFELVGGEEITVAPYSEGFITLTLKKVGDEPVNSYVTFVGTFNGEQTSRATAHVYTEGATDTGSIAFNDLPNGATISKNALKAITATLSDAEGTPLVLLNDKVYENYTFENNTFTIDLSEIEAGRYTLVVAIETDGGDYIYKHIYFTYDGKKALVK